VTPPSSTVTPNTITINNHKETITKYKGIDISKFDEEEKVFSKQLLDYRKEINSPLKTTKGLSGMINDINSVMTECEMTYKQVVDVLMANEWKTIKINYSFDRPQSKKGTFDNVSDDTKLRMIAKKAEDKGIEAWENGEVKQSVIDAFNEGELLKLA
jgi:hypothetical protein